MVCLGNICINTLHKGAKDDDDDDDDNRDILSLSVQSTGEIRHNEKYDTTEIISLELRG
jgi:hypothetical protein